MTLYYTFIKNCKEYDYEYEADDTEIFNLIKEEMAEDGYDIYEVADCFVDEYIENAIDYIKDHFCSAAYDEWKESKMSAYEYYGLNERDYH